MPRTLDCEVEQDGLLPHQPQLLAQPAQVEAADVNAVQQHLAADRVVEALDEADHGALAAAALAHQRHGAARGNREVEAAEHFDL